MTTWRELIGEAFKAGDTWDDVIATTLTDKQFDTEFNAGFGGSEGCPFTLWTKRRVYFPVVYDGAEWVCSAPRDPCDEVCVHVGGE